jgi:5-methylcytosine-specific restriction endonuclease McrA
VNFTHFGKTVGNRARDPRRIIINRIGYGPNWPAARKAALLRDSYTCVKCGHKGVKVGRTWDVHVDHVVKIVFFVCVETETCDFEAANALTNLQTLCKTCHRCKDGHANLSNFTMLK